MHYNQGWADGFNYNIEYWEIWNEPENPGNGNNGKCQWQGTREEFYELYKVTSKHLKSRFPNIKIGGYGSCGFYHLTNKDLPESHMAFIAYFTDFLQMAKNEDCPIDFFSWHIYTDSIAELMTHAEFVRKTLDEYGFTKTEVNLNEWNVSAEGGGFAEKHSMVGGAFNGAVFSSLQNSNYVDKAMYYCFAMGLRYNGFLDSESWSETEISWYPFVAYNKLYKLQNCVENNTEGDNIYVTAAENNGKAAILITNYNGDNGKTEINIDNLNGDKKLKLSLIDEDSPLNNVLTINAKDNINMILDIKKNTVLLIEID